MKVLAALSGGVDSAVAAARAVDAGHEVTGVHLALAGSVAAEGRSHGCCSREDARDAGRVADRLGIPFYVWDLSAVFRESVVADFLSGYAAGQTPNPCLRCNEKVKFTAVLDRARGLGFDRLVTGHYVRRDAAGLRRSVDAAKDQSYVLGLLRIEQILDAWFPIGHSSKAQVRAEAAHRGLAVAGKPDSYDICFVPPGQTAGWLRDRLGSAPGPVLDTAGRVVGQHRGAYTYTVGQRRGLGLPGPDPGGRPRYVLSVEPVTRTVVVGSAAELSVTQLVTGPATFSRPVTLPLRCTVQLRAHGQTVPATVVARAGDGLRVDLDQPTRAVAPGQAVVCYQGDRVLGGARLERVTSPA